MRALIKIGHSKIVKKLHISKAHERAPVGGVEIDWVDQGRAARGGWTHEEGLI